MKRMNYKSVNSYEEVDIDDISNETNKLPVYYCNEGKHEGKARTAELN